MRNTNNVEIHNLRVPGVLASPSSERNESPICRVAWYEFKWDWYADIFLYIPKWYHINETIYLYSIYSIDHIYIVCTVYSIHSSSIHSVYSIV